MSARPDLSFLQLRNTLTGLSTRLDRLDARSPSGLWRTVNLNLAPNVALKASTTNPSIGIGATTFCRYVRMGDLVVCHIDIQFGVFVNAGAGTYQVQLPFAQSSSMTGTFGATMSARLYDASTTNTMYLSGCTINPGTTNLVMRYQAAYPVGADTVVAATAPWTWADNDRITVHVVYEAEPY